MLTLETIRGMALALGFERVAATDASPTGAPPPDAHPQALSLEADPRRILPAARSVLLLAMPYAPYWPRPGEAAVDAYYVANNRAHENARRLAEEISATGAQAVMTSSLRVKPLAVRAGLGRMGRNGLVAVGGFGSRVSLQTIVTDLPLPASREDGGALDARCDHCHLCEQACPTQALRGDGTMDIGRCVRAQPENRPLPEAMRSMTGGSLLGCDICQRCCPRNALVREAEKPPALAGALDLKRLLSGDYKALIPWLGRNNARKLRLLNRAALAAANGGRKDLLPELEALRGEPEPLGEHAAWSAETLKHGDHREIPDAGAARRSD
ncbi:MAG: epoxyqueuosine reductase [Clostridia bacterium]|nr:epoxyqueuosine reductase [Clostridia bacterium]